MQYFNEPAKRLYPELKISAKSFPKEIDEAAESGGSITINERIYEPQKNELIQGEENFGKLFVLVDETKHHDIHAGLET
ncbi:MAG: hypothetical protein IJ736_04765, partial [Firmicutes bacterium]|nr:hypothetical protein [Bacillota bacterium]